MNIRIRLLQCAVFLLVCQVSWAQLQQVSGTIKDESGVGLPGATVTIKGTTVGTATDINGSYTLSASEGDVLLYKFTGMQTESRTVAAGTDYNVVLQQGIELDEVVVTALGISKEKKALGYAVSEVKGDALAQSQEANVIQGLAAKAPGVVVTGSGGTPGASSKIVIRGASTFTGSNDPLIVIDGVPVDNRTTQSTAGDYPFNQNLSGVNASNRAVDINPDDIESVTVLKGPTAAALYGSIAGNGAIIYTTKRGKYGKGNGVGVTYSSSVEWAEVNKLPEFQQKYGMGSNGQTIAPADPGPDGIGLTADDVSFGTQRSWGPRLDTTNLQAYDNNDNFFQTGMTYENNLSLTSGNDRFAMRLSIGDLRQTGIVPNTNLNRTSFRINADARVTEKLNIGGSANFVSSQGTMAQNGSNLAGIMLGLLRTPITYDLSDYQYDNGFQRTYFVVYDNPFFTANENPFTSNVNRFIGNVFADYKLHKNIGVSYRLGIDNYSDKRKQIFAVSSFGDDIGGVGQVNLNNLISSRIYGDFLANWNKDLSEKLNLGVTLGQNFTKNQFDDVFSRGANLAIPGFYNLSNASDLYTSNATTNVNSHALFAYADLSYDNMLFLNVTGRNDWSSTFETTEQNNFFYPSVSASFVFSEKMDVSWLEFGKLRYSYAQVGIPPEAYRTRTVFTQPAFTDGFTNGVSFPFGGVNGFSLSNTQFSSQLKPEIMTGNEVGFFVSLFENFVDIDFTYYNQASKQLLGFRPVAPSSGFNQQFTNFGEMVNNGIELMVNLRPIRKEDFKWELSVNYAANRNEVTALVDGVDEIDIEAAFGSIQGFAITGEPYGALYGSMWERNSSGDLVIGANGLPLIAAESGKIGDPNPDFTMGINNSFMYKNWNFNFLFDIRQGGDIWNGTYARLMQYGRPIETEDRERDYVIPGVLEDGTANDIAITAETYFSSYLGDAGGAAEQFVEDGSWVRLRSIGLGYQFKLAPDNFFKGVGINFSARNLWLSTNYRGVDPETSLTGAGSNLAGFDYFNNPGTKSYRVKLNFSF